MNLERLTIFVKIVEAGSMSAAAGLVHLTQPALSRNLKLLEEELAAQLFERRGRGLVLTAAGRALLPRARSLLAQASTITKEVERVVGRRYFDVRVGTVDSVATYLFPKVVDPLRDAYPDLGVKLATGRTADLLRRVSADDLDLAIIAWSDEPPVARATPVGHYDLRFWGRADRFPALAAATTEAELAAFPIVQIESLPGQPTMIPEDAPTWALANSLASVKALVLAGFGVGALLGFMLTPEERCQLSVSHFDHDPHCRLWVCASPHWVSEAELAIESTLVSALTQALG
ncbi:MAG: LysR family transcriptional regulator [Myxococcota bacterium]